MSILCPNNHHLEDFKTSTSTFTCDSCHKKVLAGSSMQHCKICSWYCCRKCFKKKNEQQDIFTIKEHHKSCRKLSRKHKTKGKNRNFVQNKSKSQIMSRQKT